MPSSHIQGYRKVHKAARSTKAAGGDTNPKLPLPPETSPRNYRTESLVFLGTSQQIS